MASAERSTFRVGLIQMACSPDSHENLEKAIWRIREAAGRGAHIICLPELFQSHYFCREEDPRWFALAEPVPGPTTEALGRLAAELEVVIVASLFERRAAGLYHNTAAVIDAGGAFVGRYRKVRPDRSVALLGPVVSGGGAAGQLARGESAALSDCDRVASL